MRVRIRQSPFNKSEWVVETKNWWEFSWKGFLYSVPEERARETALALKNPYIIEML